MRINNKRKHEIAEVEEDEDFSQHESEYLGEQTYKKYKFIQAFSRLSINDSDGESTNVDKNQSACSLDLLYSDLTKMFSKNVKITHTEKISYKKKHHNQQTEKQRSQIPPSNDSLVLYKGSSMNTLMSNFMNFLTRTKFVTGKQKSKSENIQEPLKVIIEESDTEEEVQIMHQED